MRKKNELLTFFFLFFFLWNRAMSSVLLIQKDRYNDDLKAIVGKETLDIIDDEMQKHYKTRCYCGGVFDSTLEGSIRQIIKVKKRDNHGSEKIKKKITHKIYYPMLSYLEC